MEYIPRLSCPEKNNKFYIKKPAGYNPCILGNIKYRDPYLNNLPNCVGYAFGRFHEIFEDISFSCYTKGNAEELIRNLSNIGLSVGTVPKLGGMMVWQKGSTLNGADGAGHVSVVEKIKSDNEIIVSQSGWKSRMPFWIAIHKKGSGNWIEGTDAGWMNSGYSYLGCVYNAYQKIIEPTRTLSKGSQGWDVKWLQIKLNLKLDTRLQIDGKFGSKTEIALMKYQTMCRLRATGICDKLVVMRLRNSRK